MRRCHKDVEQLCWLLEGPQRRLCDRKMTDFGNFEDRHSTVRGPGLSGFWLDCRITVVNIIPLTMQTTHKLICESYSP